MFDEYKNALSEIKENQIFTAQELLTSEKYKTYGVETILPNKTCSFRLSYISSYLLVSGCIEHIEKNLHLSKPQAIQYFLEIVKQSNCLNEYLIYDIANALDISPENLLTSKTMQLNILRNIIENKQISR